MCKFHRGGVYDRAYVQKRLDRSDEVEEGGEKLSAKLRPSGQDDMSILAMQRLNNQYVSMSSFDPAKRRPRTGLFS